MAATRYQYLNDTQLHYHFVSYNWRSHTYEERYELCQELENRLAAQRGTQPRELVPEDMKGQAFGAQWHDKLYVNENILRNNQFVTEVKDPNTKQVTGVRFEDVDAPGWQMMDTIVHEDTHGMDEDNGEIQGPSYIAPKENYNLYRIQRSEKKAYETAEDYTLDAISNLETAGITDSEAEDYRRMTGQYDYYLEEAKFEFNDEHIDETLDQVIDEIETGQMVEESERGAAYDQIYNVYDQQMMHRMQGYDRGYDPLEQYRTESRVQNASQTEQNTYDPLARYQNEQSAKEQMTRYMHEHNYGISDQNTYMQDPEWRRLSAAYRAEQGLRPLENDPRQEHLNQVRSELSARGIPEDSELMNAVLENEAQHYDPRMALKETGVERYSENHDSAGVKSTSHVTEVSVTTEKKDPLEQYKTGSGNKASEQYEHKYDRER